MTTITTAATTTTTTTTTKLPNKTNRKPSILTTVTRLYCVWGTH